MHNYSIFNLETHDVKNYWFDETVVKRDIERMVRECASCRQRKNDGTKAPIQGVLEPSEPFELVSMDIVNPGQTTRTGYKYILTVVDHHTRYAMAFPLFTKTTEEVAQHFVRHVLLEYGVPKQLLTDQGTEFMSHLMVDICRLFNVKKLRTTPYHPECNGVVERFHGTLNKILAHFVRPSGSDWDRWIPYALAAYRTTEHSATGFNPFYIVHGWEMARPGEDWALPAGEPGTQRNDTVDGIRTGLQEARAAAREEIHKQWERRTRRCNKRRRPHIFEEGDLVYLHTTVRPAGASKFFCPWLGPHKVVARLSDVNYRLQLAGGGETVVHASRLKLAEKGGLSSAEEDEEDPPPPQPRAAQRPTGEPNGEQRAEAEEDELLLLLAGGGDDDSMSWGGRPDHWAPATSAGVNRTDTTRIVATLEASTFASCLVNYIEELYETEHRPKVIAWSDGCMAQNRNSIISNALLHLSCKLNTKIVQKYLEKGHTQMEVDSVHSHIEKTMKHQQIYTPTGYVTVTLASRIHPVPYRAT